MKTPSRSKAIAALLVAIPGLVMIFCVYLVESVACPSTPGAVSLSPDGHYVARAQQSAGGGGSWQNPSFVEIERVRNPTLAVALEKLRRLLPARKFQADRIFADDIAAGPVRLQWAGIRSLVIHYPLSTRDATTCAPKWHDVEIRCEALRSNAVPK
jgi:hypothetical protein